ncbi:MULTISPECIES: hypothetical protein [Pseudomonas]|uniref:hypothetical protein n=1 Tax=Pseudomonas TaxID=286 RepID=UPI0023642B69|nr:hypothetical protein [Pseudomonas putida]MDD2014215.1 hypothetical protein [Pseudomonas putida]MDD2075525.1 hypothetical protein [Pseudomonas putida]
MVAAWCIGSHRPGRRMVGFCCFIASNILWSVWGWHAQAWALIVLQLALCVMNLRGWRKNKSASTKAQVTLAEHPFAPPEEGRQTHG